MITIEWRHYCIMLAIRDSGTVSAAANALGLTQSAASHQVREAERRLGVTLLARRGRSVRLTQAGEAIAGAAAACAPVMLAAENQAQEQSHGSRPRLRIAFGPQDGLDWVISASARLLARAEPMGLDLIAAQPELPTQILRLAKADIAVDVGDVGFADLKRVFVCDDELVCIVAPDHPLAATSRVAAAELAGETFFAHSLVPKPGFELEAFFRPARRLPAHAAQVQSLSAIVALVAAGRGVSIQPRSAIAQALHSGHLAALSLLPERIVQPWYLHARPDVLAAWGEPLLDDLVAAMRPHLAAP